MQLFTVCDYTSHLTSIVTIIYCTRLATSIMPFDCPPPFFLRGACGCVSQCIPFEEVFLIYMAEQLATGKLTRSRPRLHAKKSRARTLLLWTFHNWLGRNNRSQRRVQTSWRDSGGKKEANVASLLHDAAFIICLSEWCWWKAREVAIALSSLAWNFVWVRWGTSSLSTFS